MSAEDTQKACAIIASIDLGAAPAKQITSPKAILETLGAMTIFRRNADSYQVLSNLFRQRVMLCEHHFSNVLTGSLEDDVRNIIENNEHLHTTPDTNGLVRLTADLYTYFSSPKKKTMLDPNKYIDHTTTAFPLPPVYRRNLDTELLDIVPRTVVSVVRHCFALPNHFHTGARADYAGLLLERFGAGVFLLPHVWDVYETMPTWGCGANVWDAWTGQNSPKTCT